jgi:hypothetical protein
VLEKWLRNEQQTAHSDVLHVREVIADAEAEGDDLDAWLGHELMRNYFAPANRAVLAETLKDLGLPGLADWALANKFPTMDVVRSGEFGEALVGAVLRKLRRYTLPILKLRYKHKPNAPVQGADLLAFRLSTNPPVVAVPEVKTRTLRQKPDYDVGKEAHDSLASVLRTLDSSIEFVGARLIDQENLPLATRVLALLTEKPKQIERHVFVVHEDSQWRDRVVEKLAEVVTDTTEFTVIRMQKLKERISTTYEAAARALHPDSRSASDTSTSEPPDA